MPKAEKKRQEILDAAIYRFSHLGVAKTTMAEIAADLSISKASLYYYYADRNSLFAAVFERITGDVAANINAQIAQGLGTDPYKAMEYVLDTRIAFLTKHYKLLAGLQAYRNEFPEAIQEAINRGREQELSIIRRILAAATENGTLRIENIEETTNMFFYAIVGMRFAVLQMAKIEFFPTQEEFDRILVLQKKLVVIMLDGLATAPKSAKR